VGKKTATLQELLELSNKDVKNGHAEWKSSLFDFVMATQASDFCLLAFWAHPKKRNRCGGLLI